MIANNTGTDCFETNDVIPGECDYNNISRFSMVNRRTSDLGIRIQSWVLFVNVLFLVVAMQFLRK